MPRKNVQSKYYKHLSRHASLVECLRSHAVKRPDSIAIKFIPDGKEVSIELSYAELDQRVRSVADQLKKQNLSEQRIMLMLSTGLDFLIAFFGCLYSGAIAVPSYPPRPNRSLERCRVLIADAKPAAILVSKQSLENISLLKINGNGSKSLQILDMDFLYEGDADQWVEPGACHDTLALLQYTSGSTSTPKGVMVSHGNILHNLEMLAEALDPSDETLVISWLPLFHDMGLIGGCLTPICLGFPVFLMTPESFLMRPFRWLQAISKFCITWAVAPNFAYEYCVNRITAEQRKQLDLSCWQVALVGAEPIRSSTLSVFSETFHNSGFAAKAFYPCYGLAEATLFVTGGTRDDDPVLYEQGVTTASHERVFLAGASSHENHTALVSSGRTWNHGTVVIVDVDTMKVCPPGEIGEIWINGPNVTKGYWEKPEATQETYHANLVNGDGRKYLRSGDFGFQLGENLFVTGRSKNIMIVAGRNVHLEDVEYTVSCCHPILRIGGCAAFSIEKGNTELLVLVVELKRQVTNALKEEEGKEKMMALKLIEEISINIKETVTQQHELSTHKIVFVKVGKISKTSSGKIQRHICRKKYLENELTSTI